MRIALAVVLLIAVTSPLLAQTDPDLEARVRRLEHKVGDTTSGVTIWLYGAVCALWAQNTRRNAWLWFFLGLFFSVITVLVLLYKNSEDRNPTSAVTT